MKIQSATVDLEENGFHTEAALFQQATLGRFEHFLIPMVTLFNPT